MIRMAAGKARQSTARSRPAHRSTWKGARGRRAKSSSSRCGRTRCPSKSQSPNPKTQIPTSFGTLGFFLDFLGFGIWDLGFGPWDLLPAANAGRRHVRVVVVDVVVPNPRAFFIQPAE